MHMVKEDGKASTDNQNGLRGTQNPDQYQHHPDSDKAFGSESGIPEHQPIRTDREGSEGTATRRRTRVRPQTHGGTLRCLIDGVQSQSKALRKKLERYDQEIVECHEELFRLRKQEETLAELLENWQRNVDEITDQGD